jgi:hypothetical protein
MDPNNTENEAKSKNQEKNEAKRKAKMEKFLAKQAKIGAQSVNQSNSFSVRQLVLYLPPLRNLTKHLPLKRKRKRKR